MKYLVLFLFVLSCASKPPMSEEIVEVATDVPAPTIVQEQPPQAPEPQMDEPPLPVEQPTRKLSKKLPKKKAMKVKKAKKAKKCESKCK